MKKFLGIIFTCLLFASCENFLTGNLDTANKMAEEVRYNTAAQILVSVVSDHGTVVTGFNRDARVGIPFEIELSLPKNSGVFEKWYAVIRDKDNNETPLTSDDIVFENENSLKTNVTLLKEIRGVYVVAKVHENPVLSISYDNIDFYSKNSTSEAKRLIANKVRLTGNESFSYQNFVIQTTNDYGISFDRIKFISSDGVEEIDIPVYTLDQFYALGENIPDPYTYIINCEDGNPETKSDNDGSYYSSAVTNSLLCLFDVTENNLPEGAVKVSFNACLFHSLESMVYVKPVSVSYLKVSGNIEGYENTTITPNTQKVVLPSKDLSFKISIPDQYSYDSLSFSTESGAVPDVYISDSDTVDETLEEVKSAAFAIYSLYVETTDSNAYETKTTVSFNVKSINGFSETVIIRPVLKLKQPVSFTADTNSSVTPSGDIKTMSESGVNFTFTATDLYAISAILIKDSSGKQLYKYETTGNKTIPENILMGTDSKNYYANIKAPKLESNLSKFSGTLYVNSELTQSITLTAETKIRPTVHNTEPYTYEKNVMRTSPIYIRFSKPMKAFENEASYLDYISIERCDSSSVLDGQGENVFEAVTYGAGWHPRYFKNPELKNNGYELLISTVNNTVESEWMKSGSEVRVHINKNFTDAEGIPLLDDYNFTYTLGTSGDSTGPIITTDKTSLSILSSGKTISQSVWGDFEPSTNADVNHTYADSIHVGPGEKFIAKIQASDASTGDTGIKDFVADVRLMYIYEGGRLPNSSEKASKNMILFDKDGNWLYEAGCLKQDFYKEYLVPYTGTSIMADTGNGFNLSFDDFVTNETSGSLPVDGIYRIELTARDGLDNYSNNSNVYYVVRDTTPPDAEKNASKISFADDCGVEVNGKRYFGGNYNKIKLNFISNFEDSGTLGQPRLGSKKTHLNWNALLCNSSELCNDSTILLENMDWKTSEEVLSFELTESLINENNELFVWYCFKDEFGNVSEKVCSNKVQILIDNQKPLVSIIESSDYSMRNNTAYTDIYSKTNKFKMKFNISENGINNSKIKNIRLKNLLTNTDEYIDSISEYLFDVNLNYELSIEDYVGNSNSIKFNTFSLNNISNINLNTLYSSNRYGDSFAYDCEVRGFSYQPSNETYHIPFMNYLKASNGNLSDTKSSGFKIYPNYYYGDGHVEISGKVNLGNELSLDKIWFDNLKIDSCEIKKYNPKTYSSDILFSEKYLENPTMNISFVNKNIIGEVEFSIKGEILNQHDGDNSFNFHLFNGKEFSRTFSSMLDKTPPTNVEIINENNKYEIIKKSGDYYILNIPNSSTQKKEDNEYVPIKFKADDKLKISMGNGEGSGGGGITYYHCNWDYKSDSNEYFDYSFKSEEDRSALFLQVEGETYNKYNSSYENKPVNFIPESYGSDLTYYVSLNDVNREYKFYICDAFGNSKPITVNITKDDASEPNFKCNNVFASGKYWTTEDFIDIEVYDDFCGVRDVIYQSRYHTSNIYQTSDSIIRLPSDPNDNELTSYNLIITNQLGHRVEKTISFTKYTSLPTIKNVKILTPEIKVPDQSYNTYTWSSYYATTVKAIKSDKSIADDYCTTYVKNKNDVVIYFEVLLNGPGLKKDGLELLTRNGNYVIECAEGVKSDKFSIPIKLSDYTNCFLKATDSLGNSTLYKITEPSVDVSGPVISGITPSYTMTSSSSGDYIYYKYSTTHVIKINVKTNTIELYSKSKIFPSFRLNLSDTSGLYKFALSGDVSAIGGRYTTDPRTFDTSTKYLSYSVNSAQNPQTSKIWAFDKLGNVTEIEVKLYWNQTTLPTIPSN